MDLGQRLKYVRLQAVLSQRQLCCDTVTRNMLSQIENGAARPSMDTLAVLAARLHKPVSYFLEEVSVSPNQSRMTAARAAFSAGDYSAALEALGDYESPDPVFDGEKYLLEALCCLCLGDAARAAAAAGHTPYCNAEAECRWLLLRGQEAMEKGDYQTALKWFSLAEPHAPALAWPHLETCYRQLEDYKQAYHYACLQRT